MMESGTHPPLNFVIIGGGPTGVELAGAISDIAKLYMSKDFRHIDPSMAQVLILEGSPNILAAYPPDLQRKAGEQLNALGVKFRTNAHVSDVQPGYVMVGDERIDAVVTLWAAGVQASPLGKLLGVETDRRGCVLVDSHLNPPGHPEIFICGDLAHVEENGRQIPGVAQPAMQMGRYAAKRIGRLIAVSLGSDGSGRDEPFHYFNKGEHGHHRPQGRRRQYPMALQRPLERLPGMDDLARRPHLLSNRLPQPPRCLSSVGLDLPHVQ